MAMKNLSRFLCCAFLLSLIVIETSGQWTNRYPKLANVSHHVYLEGYNLPTLNQGATDPAISPDNRTIAFAARGWLWLMDLNAREARRVTKAVRAGKSVSIFDVQNKSLRQIAGGFCFAPNNLSLNIAEN